MRALMDEIVGLDLAADLQEFASAQSEQDNAAGEAWVDQLPYSRGVIYVTAGELKEFFEEYIKLLNRYHPLAGQTPPGARPVVTSFMAYPAPPPSAAGPEHESGGTASPGQEGSRLP
jgi:hypothetical protein